MRPFIANGLKPTMEGDKGAAKCTGVIARCGCCWSCGTIVAAVVAAAVAAVVAAAAVAVVVNDVATAAAAAGLTVKLGIPEGTSGAVS